MTSDIYAFANNSLYFLLNTVYVLKYRLAFRVC